MKQLTAKHEKFCQLVAAINGPIRLKDKVDSVIKTYKSIKTKVKQKAKAKELYANPAILSRIEELRNNKVGCPTKYDDKYCQEIIDYFNKPAYEPIMIKDDEGVLSVATNKQDKPLMKPCSLPTKEGFAFSIGIHCETLTNWAKKHNDFFEAFKKAENLQKNILIQNGLIGNYEKTFAIFVAKNVTDMKDQQVIEHHSSNINFDISDKTDPKEAAAAYMELIKSDEC